MVIATPLPTASASSSPSNGGRLVSTDGRTLPLTSCELDARAGGGIARVVLEQTFENPHAEALHVTYKLPLPADAAVGGFRFRVGEELIVGEIDKKQRARERFEQAIAQGKTAALLEQERTSVFTQEVGNIPPHTRVVCEIIIDQPLKWLDEGAWEWRFPTVVGPRYMGGPVQTPDAARLTVDVSEDKLPVKMSLGLRIDDAMSGRPESPSHPIDLLSKEEESSVRFRRGTGMRLDRDVVVRWPVAKLEVGVGLQLARLHGDRSEQGYGLLTVVPPTAEAQAQSVARDLIFLIDTSGSMGGRPLEQAARVASAMIDTLGERDRIELIEFSSSPRSWQRRPAFATEKNKREAIRWVKGLRAGGATEMEQAIFRALEPLRDDSQRQVVLITDGYIGFEDRIIKRILEDLPPSCRVHTIGVGSSVNRTLTQGAARAGGGVELVIGLGEDPERLAPRLLARTTRPIVTALSIRGTGVEQTVPVAMPDLYAGSPALIAVRLDAQGGEIIVGGRTAEGSYEQRIAYDPIESGSGNEGIMKLFAREWVEDLETYRHAGGGARDLDQQIERVGLEYQISTRLTSWIAVSHERTVDEDLGSRHETQPQELPYGLSIEGLGLRPAQPMLVGGLARSDEARAPARSRMAALRAKPSKRKEAAGPPPSAKSEIFDERADVEDDELASVALEEAATGEYQTDALSLFDAEGGEEVAAERSQLSVDADEVDDFGVNEAAVPAESAPEPEPSYELGRGAPAPGAPPPPMMAPVQVHSMSKQARRRSAFFWLAVGIGVVAFLVALWLLFFGAAGSSSTSSTPAPKADTTRSVEKGSPASE